MRGFVLVFLVVLVVLVVLAVFVVIVVIFAVFGRRILPSRIYRLLSVAKDDPSDLCKRNFAP